MSGRPSSSEVLAGWTPGSFTAAGFTRDTYRRGSGPGVIVVHEIPGITPKVTAFADEVVDAGFTVIMPSLVGTPGKEISTPYGMASMGKVCISREFTHWALHQTSPSSGGCAHSPGRCTRTSGVPGSVRSGCASAAGSRSG